MKFDKLISGGCEILSNPFYTAIIAAIIIMVIVIIIYHNETDTFLKKSVKAFIYVLVATTVIMFIHNNSMLQNMKVGTAEARILTELHQDPADTITGGEDDIVAFPEINLA